MTKEQLALLFHETYERLAPSFGYKTRDETQEYDPTTPNGRLMIAVCGEILQRLSVEPTPDPAKTRDMWVSWSDQDGGWIAALGNVADRKEVESRIAAEVQRTGFNRFELRPVRVTLHLNRT